MINKVAMLCLHGSPLDQPGAGSGGGMNVYVRELARALAADEIAVDIFTRSPGDQRVVEDAPGVRVIAVPAGPRGPVGKGDLADLAPALLHGIEAVAAREGYPYQLVHSHYWISGLVAQHLSRRWSVPMVHMFHTLARVKARYAGAAEDTRREHGEQRVIDAADAIVVPNAIEQAQLREQYAARSARLVTIPCGIDLAPFAPRHERAPGAARPTQPSAGSGWQPASPSRQDQTSFVVLALGRVERLKNFGLLLRAVASACGRDSEFARQVEVRIAGGPSSGEPEELPRLVELAASLGIGERVRFLGAVPRAAVPNLYAGADLCVVPSRHESFGLVALEAMAARRPVIATAVGGLQVTVSDGITGYLVPPDDEEAMARRLLELWASPVLREAMGARGARAAQHFAWPVVAERMACLYESLVSAPQEGHQAAR